MPTTHVALIRGINVGRAKRVAMADLRALATGLGWSDARTLLNSGNLLFVAPPRATTSALAARIEEAFPSVLGVAARVTVISTRELATIVAENPWAAEAPDASRLLVAVWRERGDRAALEPLAARAWDGDRLAVGTRAAYLWCPDGLLASRLPESVDRALRDRVTTRNWATISKLLGAARQ